MRLDGLSVRVEAQAAQREVERLVSQWQGLFGGPARFPKLSIQFFDDPQDFEEAVVAEGVCSPGRCPGTGYYQDGEAWVLWAGPGRERLLRHEVVHHLVASTRMGAGTWLSEALASYLESDPLFADSRWNKQILSRRAFFALSAFGSSGCDVKGIVKSRREPSGSEAWALGAFLVHHRVDELRNVVQARSHGMEAGRSVKQEQVGGELKVEIAPAELWTFLLDDLAGRRYAYGRKTAICGHGRGESSSEREGAVGKQ